MLLVSIVLPTYNEELILKLFFDNLIANLKPLKDKYSFELLFIDDGSTDRTPDILLKLTDLNHKIRIITLTRNYGHQSAISAGFDNAKGDIVITMDTDLQDPPSLILEMLKLFEEGYDVVHGTRSDRNDGVFKDLSARGFYKIFRIISGYNAVENTADFKLVNREVVNTLNQNPTSKAFLRGAIAKYGKNQTRVYYVRPARALGVSKYSLSKMIKLAINGLKFAINPNFLEEPEYEIKSNTN